VSASPTTRRALRGRVIDFADDPAVAGSAAIRDFEDGLVVVAEGKIEAVGEAAALLPTLAPGTPLDDWRGCLILPGLIDLHIHYPQTRVIASYGAQLLEWLHKYTFIEEQRFADPEHCRRSAAFFCDEMLRNGTTTAAVYCTVHPESVDAFFAEAESRRLRMIAGKVMMDRNAPAALTDTPGRGYDESKALLQRWHGRGRLGYAITPRFALTSTDAQLEAAGALAAEFPGAWVQTHLAENHDEIAAVARLFPWSKHYTEVYERHGLLGPRTLLGHCLHLCEDEVRRLAESGSIAAFCPTSNLFIGSGLFDRARLRAAGVRIGLATDVGGGTSTSMLRTAAAAYQVLQLQGQNLPAREAFYAMTLGNARALGLDGVIGSLAPGAEADLVVLDPRATPAMAHRMAAVAGDLDETLFVLAIMGDERAVRATYVLGERAAPSP
jgi:guanine deaminase